MIGDLSAEDDPLGVATSRAVCAGMQQLQDQPGAVSDANWRDFLVREVEGVLRAESLHVPQPRILGQINGVMTTIDLAQTSPQLARQYFRVCVA
jgi:hypothetical protein